MFPRFLSPAMPQIGRIPKARASYEKCARPRAAGTGVPLSREAARGIEIK